MSTWTGFFPDETELEDSLHASAAYKSYPKHKQVAMFSEQSKACAGSLIAKQREQTNPVLFVARAVSVCTFPFCFTLVAYEPYDAALSKSVL